MAGTNSKSASESRWRDQLMEFILVLVFLLVLVLLVGLVLRAPVPGPVTGENAIVGKDVLAYRSGLMSALFGTFGAWVGAGAAYFFGSKNLKQATDAIEKAQQTGMQRLSTIKLKDMDPKPQKIATKVGLDDPLSKVGKVLDSPTEWWFCVVKQDGALSTVMHEECYYRYYMEQMAQDEKTAENEKITRQMVDTQPVSKLVEWAKKNDAWNWVLYSIYVPVTMDMTAAAANEAMIAKGVHVAIVLDAKKRPTHYLTGGEIKAALERC
jgi:hypothetical protein